MARMNNMELRRRYKELDLFRKISPEVRNRLNSTSNGWVVQAIQAAFISLMVILLLLNLIDYLQPAPPEQWFSVDASESLTSDSKPKLRVMLNMTFTNLPCAALSLDYHDVMGSKVVDVRSTMFKTRLKSDGTEISVENNAPRAIVHSENRANGGPQIRLRAANDTNESCGNCYGAMEPDNCCDRCADVMYAYRLKKWALPRVEDVAQCREEAAAGRLNTGLNGPHQSTLTKGGVESAKKHEQAFDDMIWGGGSVPGFGDRKTWKAVKVEQGSTAALQVGKNPTVNMEYSDILEDGKLSLKRPEGGRGRTAVFDSATARSKHAEDPGLAREAEVIDDTVPEADSTEPSEERPEAPRRRLREVGHIAPYQGRFSPIFARDEVELQRLEEQKGEMCRFWGYFDTAKVPGNFHISTHGVSREAWEQVMGPRGGYLGFDKPSRSDFNMRHIIHRLDFVDPQTNATVGASNLMDMDDKAESRSLAYQYYLTVNPASDLTGQLPIHGYQYQGSLIGSSSNSYDLTTTFRFDIDPIRISYKLAPSKTLAHFLTHALAITGGMVAVMSMMIKVVDNVLI